MNDSSFSTDRLKSSELDLSGYIVSDVGDYSNQPIGPGDLLLSERLVELMREAVHSIREQLFDQVEPGHSSVNDSAEWIESSFEEIQDESEYGQFQEKLDSLNELANQVQAQVSLDTAKLYYQRTGTDQAQSILPPPGSSLSDLALKVSELSKKTGFKQDTLTTHILTGLKPIRPRYEITKKEHNRLNEDYQHKTVEIDILAKDIQFEEIRSIYQKTRNFLNPSHTKEFEAKHLEIYHLVREEGGIPEGNKTTFWQEIKEKWNDSHPDNQYSTWRSLQRLYQRTIDRLDQKLNG